MLWSLVSSAVTSTCLMSKVEQHDSFSYYWVFFSFPVFISLANVFLGLMKCLALWTRHMPSKKEFPKIFPCPCCLSQLMYRVCLWDLLQATWNIQSKCWQLWGKDLQDSKRKSHSVDLVNAQWRVTNLLGARGYRVHSKSGIVCLLLLPTPLRQLLFYSHILTAQP